MSRKTVYAAVVISILVVSAAIGLLSAKNVSANPIRYGPPTTTIYSPQPKNYSTQNVLLNVTVRLNGYTYSDIERVRNLNYSIDGQEPTNLTIIYPREFAPGYDAAAIVMLSGLADGSHNITVLGETTFDEDLYAGVSFVVDTQSVSTSGDTWTALAPVPTARAGLGVATVNGKIYAIGGRNSNSTLGTNEMYDTTTNTWTTKAPMPNPTCYFGVSVYQDKIYCIGSGINQVYDPSTDTWENKTPMPTPRAQLQANLVDGKIYLIGGILPNSTTTPSISNANEAYDPATDAWTTMTPVPTPVFNYASATVDGKIYVVSGYFDKGPTNKTQVYDPKTNQWASATPIPIPTSGAAAGATSGTKAPKRIYIVGGITYPASSNVPIQLYDPENGAWTYATPIQTPRTSLAVAVMDDILYAIGGIDTKIPPSTVYDANEKYTPMGYGTATPPPPSPSPSPTPSPSPSPTPSPSPSPIPASTQSPPPSPSPSPSLLLQPAQSAEPQSSGFPPELAYAAAGVAATIAAAATVTALHKRKK